MHETESRTIASRCPKLRTSKGHVVYERPPARSQLRSRKPIHRHAYYNIHAAHMPCMNSRYHCNSLQSIHFIETLTECTQRSQACDPTLHQTSGSKLCLGTDKFNKWLKKPYLNTSPPGGNSRLTRT